MLGAIHEHSFATDPKHLGFVLARYKFVAKMLTGYGRVLEVGCGDRTGAQVVIPVVQEWFGLDRSGSERDEIPAYKWDIVKDGVFYHPTLSGWDAVYALDVLEHIDPKDEDAFFENIKKSLCPRAPLIIGMPSKESQPYASELSKIHHVNCKTEDELRATMKRHFGNCFIFGMNDEVVHTGFGPLCHYRLAIGV